MEKSKNALKILITGECNAVKTYEAYSLKAKEEGYVKIAALFAALSKAERIHIKNHLNALAEDYTVVTDEVVAGSTLDNIKSAIEGESEESRELYPRLIRSIRSECKTEYGKVARLSMMWARKVEKEHARLLKRAYKALKKGIDFQFQTIYLCQVCGNIELDNLKGDVCDICGHDIQFFSPLKGEE